MNFIRKYWDLIFFPTAMIILTAALHFSGIAKLSYLEFGAVMCAITGRMLLKRENPVGLFFGVVASIIFMLYFLQVQLFGQLVLAAVYVILNGASIYSWLRPSADTGKIIRPTFLPRFWQVGIMLTVTIAAVIGATMRGTVGALDYFVMATGIIGMMLLVRKKTDAWVSFTASDIAGLALFWMSGSYLVLATMFVYIYNDIAAFFRWHKISRKTLLRDLKKL
ncbi:MAG: nicotinamide riboside transporter PnuC [Alphaproteobacteria bacterium]|nr:nicotinamide riboside transporter PnuC [Alphaproteobacteria bacterium]